MLGNRAATLTGVGMGLALMYYLDPERGRRRRALVRDKIAHSTSLSANALGVIGRDLSHRAAGAMARARRALSQHPVDDAVLVERVRARMGRVVSHPHAITVEAAGGRVRLRGPILQAEVTRLLQAAARVPGARDVVNELDVQKTAGNTPSFQGGSTPAPARIDVLQDQWSPATRLLVGASATALVGYGASRRDRPGALLAATGLGFLARAVTNMNARRLTGIGARRRAVDVRKTITVEAPVEDVYDFWSAYENFPRFMSRVLKVRPGSSERRSHWTVAGPAGAPVEFDAEVSSQIPNEAVGWRTVAGSPVAHAGLVRFERAGGARTRVHVRMSYNPPGGWLGHGVATAFGVDPMSSLDADLVRLKTLLETGRPPRDAAQPLPAF